MNFDETIDEIIFKYNLDVYYPNYKKRKKAEEYLKIWAQKSGGGEGKSDKILCLSSNETAISHVSFFTLDNNKFVYLCIPSTPIIDQKKLEKIVWEQYDQVWIVSFEGEIQIGEWLHDHGISFYSLYDSFSVYGIEFEDEYYKILSKKFNHCTKFKNFICEAEENVFLEWYYLHIMCKKANDSNLKKYYLKKLFFLSIIQRNFLVAEKYKKQIEEFKDEKVLYSKAWNDIIDVIDEISRKIGERKKDDIIMIWMDQLIYGSEKDMPYVKREMDKGIYFENAFTLFCNTYPTFRYLFTDVKKNTIDLFSREDVMNGNPSKVCELLNKYGYNFKVISSEFNHDNLKKEYCIDKQIDTYISISALLWNALICLLNSNEKCFMVVHEIVQSHGPIMTYEMTHDMLESNNNAPKLRRKRALTDLDEQIKFYISMLNENVTRIYMSDHGTGDEICRQMRCMFSVVGKYYMPQRIKNIFSYKNFYFLLEQILNKEIYEENVTCEYAEIYGFPLYNKKLISDRIKRGECFATDFEFCGCVTKENLYLVMREGRELLLDRKELPTIQYILTSEKDICNIELLYYFRNRVGSLYIDWNMEKWKYAKYYSKVYDNWKSYARNQIKELNQYLSVSGYHKIGIRMGGIHSAILYEWLDKENQERIVCFIDNNPRCECAKFGKKIVNVNAINQLDQEMIILSSYEKREFLKKESTNYPKDIDVFDIYHFLKEKGFPDKAIYCDLKGMPDSGYDVGFPFEEV